MPKGRQLLFNPATKFWSSLATKFWSSLIFSTKSSPQTKNLRKVVNSCFRPFPIIFYGWQLNLHHHHQPGATVRVEHKLPSGGRL